MSKRCVALLSMGLAAFAVHAGSETKTAESASDCWLRTMTGGDADAVAACYQEDAVMWFPGGPMAMGRAAIRDGYAGYFDAYVIKEATLSEMGHTGSGDTMTAWGTFRIVMQSKADGSEITEVGRFTDVQRLVDGRWLYAVDHASDDPPAAPAASPQG